MELLAPIDHCVEPLDAIRRPKASLPTIPNVIAEPKPDGEILTFNERGPVLAVRPYCNNAHYWQVYFDTNASIRATFGAAGSGGAGGAGLGSAVSCDASVSRPAARQLRTAITSNRPPPAAPSRNGKTRSNTDRPGGPATSPSMPTAKAYATAATAQASSKTAIP